MRIQHNIPAMNAYRNYNSNVKALQGNLQKLSSGYKINKAGDDAAGLAISEKMRAQITGLEVAQKNAKDGISLVQTAEGALTEVHTMLNRMYSLAEQSANGTYADDVDREQLQKEITSLSEEIDRIADASNFNGKKLLDGSLSGGSAGKLSIEAKAGVSTDAAKTSKGELNSGLSAPGGAGKITATITYKDESGAEKAFSIGFTVSSDKKTVTAEDGTVYTQSGAHSAAQMSGNIAAELGKSVLKDAFTFDGSTATLKYEAKEAGTSGPQIVSISIQDDTQTTAETIATKVTQAASDEYDKFDVTQIKVWDGTEADIEANTVTVEGKKFLLTKDLSNEQVLDLREKGIISVASAQNTGTAGNAADAKALAAKISEELGMPIDVDTGTTTTINVKSTSSKAASGNAGGLTLQIGDTSDNYNKMTVSVKDCHSKAIGIGSVDISKQEGASTAMTAIKDAINYVSDVRGTLGSLQNRLDHTINNLSVQQENIQDAEATIRDVDVANEMMAYTKNNILVQSAQAMLAQANQLPQGVLQLLG